MPLPTRRQVLFLESAIFKREDVRKSIRKTGIRTESAVRYEKGLDTSTCLPVINRALILLNENGQTNLKATIFICFLTETQFNAMCDAIRGHSDYAKNAVRGLGVDRLLQGMRRLALETNVPLPELYDDPGYVRSSRDSTEK